MNFVTEALKALLHSGSHAAVHETMEELHRRETYNKVGVEKSEDEKAWDFEVAKMAEFKADKKNLELQKKLLECIDKNYIPMTILPYHLYFTVDFCIKHGRKDLVQDYLKYYNDRKRNFKKVRIIKGMIFFFEVLIPFLFRLALFLIFALLVYTFFWGEPLWVRRLFG